MPADGRLNTPDFSAKITAVAWPATNDGQEPTPGRRFVRLGLEVTALGQSVSPTSPTPALSAALRWGGSSHPLSLSSIDDELGAGTGSSASASYLASVPDDTHDVDLVLSEGTFTQSFDLWTLRRVPPSPAVLYRDPTQTTLSGIAAGPAALSLSNPADGFTSTATVTLQSATLGYFAPSGTTLSPNPDQAVLSVVLDAEFPNDPDDPTGSGHYLGASAPLPASMLSFTPSGAGAAPATISDTGDTTGKGNSDDGLFDATYSFVVPATLTSGTLEVAAGSFTGAEFTLYTAESGTTTLDVTAPAILALSFPAPVAQATQRTPTWVGQPDPPTSVLASHNSGGSVGSSGSHGFPIWVAIVALLLVVLAVVVVQRRRRRPSPAPSTAGGLADDPLRADAPLAETAQNSAGPSVAPQVVAMDTESERAGRSMALDFMGWRQLVGFPAEGGSPILEALATYLVCHDAHHLSADQIALGMWPLGRPRGDVSRKTIHNNLSQLRAWVGVEHLPDAAVAGGYLLEGIDSDWARFARLAREADTLGGDAARALRAEALELVRGRPFEGLRGDGYQWVDEEGLVGIMTKAIVTCTTRLGTDLIEAGEFAAAEDAARAGLRGAPYEYVLWDLGARAIGARGDRTALETWLAEAGRHLDPADVERIRTSLPHDDIPES